MKQLIPIFLLFTLTSFSTLIRAEVVTAAQDPWPPFVKDSIQKGVSVEIVSAALESQGYELQFKNMPWSRAINEVRNGNIDILPATWLTQERTDYLIYSEPYMANRITFIKRFDDDFEYVDLDSLTDKKVGVVRGYGYDEAFLSAIHFDKPVADNPLANFRKLLSGRIDLTLDDEVVAMSVMQEAGLDVSQVAFTSTALSTKDLYVTSGRANSKGQKIIEAFNLGLEAIRSNGTFDEILSRYGVR